MTPVKDPQIPALYQTTLSSAVERLIQSLCKLDHPPTTPGQHLNKIRTRPHLTGVIYETPNNRTEVTPYQPPKCHVFVFIPLFLISTNTPVQQQYSLKYRANSYQSMITPVKQYFATLHLSNKQVQSHYYLSNPPTI